MNTEYIIFQQERGGAVYIVPAYSHVVKYVKDEIHILNSNTGQCLGIVYYVHGGKFDLQQSFYAARNTALSWQSISIVPE
jgi:hypothetical protein